MAVTAEHRLAAEGALLRSVGGAGSDRAGRVNARLRSTFVAPLRPLVRRVQTRIDNAVRAGDERREQRLQEIAAQLRDEQATEAALTAPAP